MESDEEKYFTLKQALDFLGSKGIKRSIGWIRIEILKKTIRSFRLHNSRVVMKEDVIKLANSLK